MNREGLQGYYNTYRVSAGPEMNQSQYTKKMNGRGFEKRKQKQGQKQLLINIKEREKNTWRRGIKQISESEKIQTGFKEG